MFDKATRRLVCQIDPGGDLIAVSRLTDSEKLKPLTVVMKCPPVWFWQTTKYRPTVFTLNDLLQGEPIQPVLEQTELLTYQEKRKGNVSGSLEAGASVLSVSAGGSGTAALSSSLGTLRKENVKIQKLLEHSKDRSLDLLHPVIQQQPGKSKHKKVFTLVMERVFTTTTCRIEYSSLEEGSCTATLKPLKIGATQVSLKESGSIHFDINAVMAIPPNTVMAYSVRELNIKSDGQYDIRIWPERMEADDLSVNPDNTEEEVDGLLAEIQDGSLLSSLKTVLEEAKSLLCVLAGLPPQSRSPLLLQLRQILLNHEHLSVLEERLEELVYDDAPSLYQTSCFHSPHQIIDTFLDLLIQSDTTSETSLSTESTNPGASMRLSKQNRPLLVAMYNLVSAAMGLTDDGLLLLENFCSSQELNELNELGGCSRAVRGGSHHRGRRLSEAREPGGSGPARWYWFGAFPATREAPGVASPWWRVLSRSQLRTLPCGRATMSSACRYAHVCTSVGVGCS
ncbi:gasdermin-E-like isoform X2 [Brachyhypopomus gauderio]|uniref:gasdermin-E-like isoform X2 n=1 Tax=Brachyhypopomus gauderio TaxID=698409 RepID=UPI004041F744